MRQTESGLVWVEPEDGEVTDIPDAHISGKGWEPYTDLGTFKDVIARESEVAYLVGFAQSVKDAVIDIPTFDQDDDRPVIVSHNSCNFETYCAPLTINSFYPPEVCGCPLVRATVRLEYEGGGVIEAEFLGSTNPQALRKPT